MANVSFYLIYGERKQKYRNMSSDTPLAELKEIAEEDFGVKNPVIMYYDEEDKEWFQVGKRFTIKDKDQFKIVQTDDKGNIVDIETPEAKAKLEEEARKKSNDAAVEKWKAKINTVQQSISKAQGMAFIVGMYDAAGANKDVQAMEKVFENDLGFAVIRETNMTPFDLKTLVEAASIDNYGLKCKYIAFYYAGHGGTDDYGRSFVCPISDDKKFVYMEADIIRKLEHLQNKCLLFMFDCCLNISGGAGQSSHEFEAKPMHKNSYVAFATTFGDKSQGSARYGGNWTRTLCKKLAEDKDFVMIMEETAYAVKDEYGKLPQRYSNLSKPVNLKATKKTGGIDPFEQTPSFKHMDTVLRPYAAQYDRIGRILDLDYATRRRIDMDNIQYLGADKKLEAIIDEWRQNYPNVKWKDFIKALRDDNLNRLASDIEDFLKEQKW